MDGTSPHGDGENKINGPSLSFPLRRLSNRQLKTALAKRDGGSRLPSRLQPRTHLVGH